MRYFLFLVILPLCAGFAEVEKRLPLTLAGGKITIDGVVDPDWASADSIADFFQFQPYFNQPPSRKTIAKVLSTSEALYCLMICYDSRENIQANKGVLDQTSGDVVSIMLDTFGDKQSAYKFAVAASGVRADCRLLDDGRNRDYSWDGVWFADAEVYDWGFVVEMEIPYASIKYNAGLGAWGLDFDRWIPSNMEDLYWCSYEQNEGQRISKFGSLELNGFRPGATGMNLELYPVALTRATYEPGGSYAVDPQIGLDMFYNPSEHLTAQLTANPDFAQIEADPFSFNITRYEAYFSERRPFFTEGNEIFMASGREQNSGFYRPMELFYSRRIGKLLPGGTEVPLTLGSKAFGRFEEWEYGGFVAMTGETDYLEEGLRKTEPRAVFGSARLKKTILDNSSVGMLFVAKRTREGTSGVVDIDGAFRSSEWQLAYQLARSFSNGDGDFAGSIGFGSRSKTWFNRVRIRAIGTGFDVQDVGFVPWRGTVESVGLTGPAWYYDDGPVRNVLIYVGPAATYEDADLYTDWAGVIGLNMQFRDNWGFEMSFNAGRSKDEQLVYTSYGFDVSSWFFTSPKWNANLWGGYMRSYNFARSYVAPYSWGGFSVEWKPASVLEIGTSFDTYVEGNPEGETEEVTYNARPELTLSPLNNLSLRVYVDNVFVRSTDRLERVLVGFLFTYNFLPKSWIYFAVNEARDRSQETGATGTLLPRRMHLVDRVGVCKVKYLYYF